MANVFPTSPARLDFGGKGFNAPSVDPLRKGSTFRRRIVTPDYDLTGHEIRASVKEAYGQAPEVFFSTTETDVNEPRIEIDPQDGGWFEFAMPAAKTALLDAGTGDCFPRRKKYVYDLEIVTPAPDNKVFAFLEGEFWIVDELTTES
jgi:hypothetical protein